MAQTSLTCHILNWYTTNTTSNRLNEIGYFTLIWLYFDTSWFGGVKTLEKRDYNYISLQILICKPFLKRPVLSNKLAVMGRGGWRFSTGMLSPEKRGKVGMPDCPLLYPVLAELFLPLKLDSAVRHDALKRSFEYGLFLPLFAGFPPLLILSLQ